MQTEKVDLYKYFGVKRKNNESGYLNSFIHSFSKYYPTRKRPSIIVVAGGGYSGICEREGEPVALAYAGKGYNVFTLEYSCAPYSYPTQLIEGCMAVAYVKLNAEKFGINKVAMAGFSAGGHLTAMVANLFTEQCVKDILQRNCNLSRPDAIVLGYPVISSAESAHLDSIKNLTANNESLFEKVSLEKQVKKDSSPTFIWTTVNDDLVPSENAFLYANSCKKNNVAFELHAFCDGHHGLALANKETATPLGRVLNSTVEDYIKPDVEPWFEMSITFLKKFGFETTD